MVFSSLFFLFGYLPVVLLLYHLAPGRAKNAVATAASLLFYAWGAPRFVAILVLSCLANFIIGRRIADHPARARTWLAAGLTLNVALLLYFKYANFFVGQCNAALAAAGLEQLGWTTIALPIGISFFTFHEISYLVDIRRGTARPASSFPDYLLYVTLFPQLIAGPIIRYHDVAAQIRQRAHTLDRFARGIARFGLGLGKKVLVANALASVADQAFAATPGTLTPAAAWIGLLAYAFQIYFDFSGYSDMAIGLGRMLGLEFLENFNAPYIARSFTDFWRRWHISLSNFMREYLYVPLGGNRAGPLRTYLNLWIVFLISGFWHGAAWNFIVWGAFHGLFLSLDKLARDRRLPQPPALLAIPSTFLLVCFSWVFFRADHLTAAGAYFHALFGGRGPAAPAVTMDTLLDPHTATLLVIAALTSFLPALTVRGRPLEQLRAEHLPPAAQLAGGFGALLLITLSAMALAIGGFNPFIYFRF